MAPRASPCGLSPLPVWSPGGGGLSPPRPRPSAPPAGLGFRRRFPAGHSGAFSPACSPPAGVGSGWGLRDSRGLIHRRAGSSHPAAPGQSALPGLSALDGSPPPAPARCPRLPNAPSPARSSGAAPLGPGRGEGGLASGVTAHRHTQCSRLPPHPGRPRRPLRGRFRAGGGMGGFQRARLGPD